MFRVSDDDFFKGAIRLDRLMGPQNPETPKLPNRV